ncbi:starvation-inducible transcriptional regulator [Cronobacter phage S13]|jgi:hypothetical protein|uniref:Uncharacterized protein n=1 Tax=Cronobacter phage LPCS28 TaxID=2924885 RepID=A0AAE9K5D0_9CAUD|nr:starvation-inducible transcriptional regulator [Cronobacter phage S13]YP_010665782.1 starvation-inducible transcriptional regulator [Cronobacter phage LPCS28]AIA64999.1 hypothetical protein S13_202 [Cronobacter phage S13]UNY46971.1 hypothetical protein EHEKIMEA_00089 [Cronobacter phage LPCS28]
MSFKDFKNKKEASVSAFITAGLSAVTYAHIIHLNENDYNRHVILDEFYKALPELMDAFAEAWLADNSGISMELPRLTSEVPEDMIQALVEMGSSIRPHLIPALQSQMDSIVMQCKQTLYKLRKLTKGTK